MAEPGSLYRVRIEPDGLEFTATAERPVLLSAQDAGIEMPSSCRNGTCRACIAWLLEGSVTYRIEWPGLLPEEKGTHVLPCCAYPASDLSLAPLR
jgi:ferredoxin